MLCQLSSPQSQVFPRIFFLSHLRICGNFRLVPLFLCMVNFSHTMMTLRPYMCLKSNHDRPRINRMTFRERRRQNAKMSSVPLSWFTQSIDTCWIGCRSQRKQIEHQWPKEKFFVSKGSFPAVLASSCNKRCHLPPKNFAYVRGRSCRDSRDAALSQECTMQAEIRCRHHILQ